MAMKFLLLPSQKANIQLQTKLSTQFGLLLSADSNQKQSDQVIKARVQVIYFVNVKPKSEKGLGFLK